MQQAATCQRLCHAACQRKTASSPPKPCHHQSQRHTRSVMPLAKKQQAPRQPERKHAKQGGWASTTLPHAATYRPNPLACKRAARPEYRPCCLKATAARIKNHPPWDGLKICQFAFLRKGRSLPRSTLCSSLPPLHKKFAWHGEALVPPGNG